MAAEANPATQAHAAAEAGTARASVAEAKVETKAARAVLEFSPPLRRSADPFGTSPMGPNVSRSATTPKACRWFKTMSWARWRRRSTACRRVWLSGNDFTRHSDYVDPALAARLLDQGDDVFTGERRQVTVMFVDVRDFTPFAEPNTAEDAVARLNALFEIDVPAVVNAGGHVNKFLGDGALVVFGAPNDLADHADAAVSAAVLTQGLVAERFGGELQIGIGINTGAEIAGIVGGAGKLEFTLIGDTVNVAARVEKLTKTTGDTILLTQHTVDALDGRSPELVDRGAHTLKGKSTPVQVFGLGSNDASGW